MAAAISCAELCNRVSIRCWRTCFRVHGKTSAYWTCGAGCQANYMACLALCAGETVVDTLIDVAQAVEDFVRTHPNLVAGTIVVIAGVTFYVVINSLGLPILVAL